MSYKSTLQAHNARLQENSNLLAQAIEKANGLPDAGGGTPSEEPVLEEISIVENGVYEPETGVDGFSKVTVAVPTGGGGSDAEVPWLTREVTEYSHPTLTTLGAYALSGTQVTSLHLPELTTIAGYTFRECMMLANMVFPKLIDVPYNGCREWKGLVKADFHALKAIGANGFYQCTNLETLIIRTPTLCTLASGTVFSASKIEAMTGGIYVPASLVETYRSASNWSKYAAIIYAIEDYPEITGG